MVSSPYFFARYSPHKLSTPARPHIHPAPLFQEQHTPQSIAQIALATPVLLDHPAQGPGVDVRSGKAAGAQQGFLEVLAQVPIGTSTPFTLI